MLPNDAVLAFYNTNVVVVILLDNILFRNMQSSRLNVILSFQRKQLVNQFVRKLSVLAVILYL